MTTEEHMYNQFMKDKKLSNEPRGNIVQIIEAPDYSYFVDNFGTPISFSKTKEIIDGLEKFLTKFDEQTVLNHHENVLAHDSKIAKQKEELEVSKSRINTVAGVVYIIRGESGRYKIGATMNLRQRLSSLRNSSSETYEIIHTIKSNNIYKYEEKLHLKYQCCRSHSEWFDLSDEMVKEIKCIPEQNDEG